MSNEDCVNSLVSLAILGTDRATLSVENLPDHLQQTVGNIQAHSADAEEAFFKVTGLILTSFSLDSVLTENSFSIEQSNQYQHLLETQLPAQAMSKRAKKLSKAQEQDLDPLLVQVKNHAGPLPLNTIKDVALPVFPAEINSLFSLRPEISGYSCNSRIDVDIRYLWNYWFLDKLTGYPMQLDSAVGSEIFQSLVNAEKINSWFENSHWMMSAFDVYDKLLAVGGDSVRYAVSVLSNKKDVRALAEARRQLALSGDVNTQINYEELLGKVAPKDMLGIFIKLRLEDPAKARELFAAKYKRFGYEMRTAFLRCFVIGISDADEPFLTSVMQDDTCRNLAFDILSVLPNSKLSKLCAALCSKFLRFEQDHWGMDDIVFSQELRDIGVGEYISKLKSQEQTKAILKRLLSGMSWSDIKALAQTNDDVEALKRWKMLIRSSHDTGVYAFHFWEGILANRISLENSSSLAKTFFEVFGKEGTITRSHISLMMNIRASERPKFIEYSKDVNNNIWYVEKGDNPLAFKPLDDQWAKAVLDHLLSQRLYVYRTCADFYCGMYFGYNMIHVCKQMLDEINVKIKQSEQGLAQALDASQDQHVLDRFKGQADLLEFILNILRNRQKIEQTIASVLGPVKA